MMAAPLSRLARPWLVIGLLILLFLSALPVQGLASEKIYRETEQIWRCEFLSEALGRPSRFLVILPRGAGLKSAPLPVIYLLHGRGRNERSLLEDVETKGMLESSRCAIILPRGEDGWYINATGGTKEPYANLLDEVIAHAERHFPVSTEPPERAIAGWSMGGFGAAYTAGRMPGRFAAMATMIGLVDFPCPPKEQTGYPVPAKTFGTDEAWWNSINPSRHPVRLQSLRIMIAYADKAFDRGMNEVFIRNLNESGNPPEVRLIQGGHTMESVRTLLPYVLRFLEGCIQNEASVPAKPETIPSAHSL